MPNANAIKTMSFGLQNQLLQLYYTKLRILLIIYIRNLFNLIMKTNDKQYILITGGAGFIGSHIVDELIYENYNIIIADNLSNSKRENINKNAIFYKIDIKDNKIVLV